MIFIDETCWASRCDEKATHVLTMLVHHDTLGDMQSEYGYCLEHVLYFAAWLPYRYPGDQELISITPPAEEFFGY